MSTVSIPTVIIESTEEEVPKVKNPNKLFYSMANLEGTYEDLANWISELSLSGAKEKVTTQDIVIFLDTKSRVPPGILKKYKSTEPKVTQDLCVAICNGSKVQCKNESTEDSNLCKTHQRFPPKRTINDPVSEETKVKRKRKRKNKKDSEVKNDDVIVSKKQVKAKKAMLKELEELKTQIQESDYNDPNYVINTEEEEEEEDDEEYKIDPNEVSELVAESYEYNKNIKEVKKNHREVMHEIKMNK